MLVKHQSVSSERELLPIVGSADIDLVIFDCDGVLVDSEPIAIAELVDQLVLRGANVDLDYAYANYLGRNAETVASSLKTDFGLVLSGSDGAAMTERLFHRLRRELKSIPGVAAAIDGLDRPVCVASSSSLDRVHLSLEVTGLRPRFEPHIFSASMVAHGKPAPDLFLLAARKLGVAPSRCLVIEDSPVGIEAAHKAGMTVFGFAGGSHVVPAHLEPRIEQAGPARIFHDMTTLPDLLR